MTIFECITNKNIDIDIRLFISWFWDKSEFTFDRFGILILDTESKTNVCIPFRIFEFNNLFSKSLTYDEIHSVMTS